MKRTILTATALVVTSFTPAALPVVAPLGVASAQTAQCTADLPGEGDWSWVGPSIVSTSQQISFSNYVRPGMSHIVDATKTTTTTTTYKCQAKNPGGQMVEAHDYTFQSQSTSVETNVRICFQGVASNGYTGTCPTASEAWSGI